MSQAHKSLDQPGASLRRYEGEYGAHVHEHAQVLVGLHGRLQLELDGRAAYVDASCALVVPAGVAHGYLELPATETVLLRRPIDATHRTSSVSRHFGATACPQSAHAI